MGEELATSRPLDHGSLPAIFEAGIYIPWFLLGTKRVGSGLMQCRDQKSIVAWADLLSARCQFTTRRNKLRRMEPSRKNKSVFPFLPRRRHDKIFSCLLKAKIVWKQHIETSRFHSHRSTYDMSLVLAAFFSKAESGHVQTPNRNKNKNEKRNEDK